LAARKFIAGEPMKPRRTPRTAGRRRPSACRSVGDAGIHHDQPVGQRHRLDLVVGDVDRGDAELALQPLDLEPHLHPQLGVEVGERLVEQEHRGLAHDGAAHGDALALAARQAGAAGARAAAELERSWPPCAPAVDVVLASFRIFRP
jgi:hypothetical protein